MLTWAKKLNGCCLEMLILIVCYRSKGFPGKNKTISPRKKGHCARLCPSITPPPHPPKFEMRINKSGEWRQATFFFWRGGDYHQENRVISSSKLPRLTRRSEEVHSTMSKTSQKAQDVYWWLARTAQKPFCKRVEGSSKKLRFPAVSIGRHH